MNHHFTHLHLHTEFSLLDGAIGIEELVAFGKQNQLKALAMSDHGNIFGAVQFFQKAAAAGIKPVLGMEAYFTEDCAVKNSEKKYYHLLLIVENEIGYRNLCALIAHSYTKGFYFKPRIDYAILSKHAEGLIATSACLGGHIPSLLMQGEFELARQKTAWFLDLFGPERFYLEVQPGEYEDQRNLNTHIFALSAEMGIPVVATGDCHYVHKDDHHAHEVMLAVQTRSTMADAGRFTFGDCRAYIRTPQEMLDAFPDNPEVVWNAGRIADRCNFSFSTGKLYFPAYAVPETQTPESYCEELCWQGLDTLIEAGRIDGANKETYAERLKEELSLITRMGFVTYFLVVSDFIRWAKRQQIPVGPGRGSAAGSLVAWVLEITDVDPIKYNLLFERFLNPERISMPDIDIDFCIEGRDKVIAYVRDRYGHDHVCQIITFGTMMAKGVIKDVARALGLPFDDSQAITELIPEQLKITLKEALEQEPRLKQLLDTNPKVKEIFDIAFRLEGLTRHASKHAAGVVITPRPVTEMLPVYIPPKTDELVTQYSMNDLEWLGFLKIDFLGLKNLTLIKRVLGQILHNHGVSIDPALLPLDDPKTFELVCRGDTSGVFQLESQGLKEVLRRLQPEKFEDIIAVNALYRPGPLGSGMVDDFIARRHGEQRITYLFPELEPVLSETYGVIVYQEQVMHIASTIAGFSLGAADILRKAMGKKKAEEMAKQKDIFIKGARARNFSEFKAAELFDLMAYFAGYGFNKSHSTAYALIAYQTAYLKAHYPSEFMASLISLETGNPDTMTAYLQEARSMGIPIVKPDINGSEVRFIARNGSIIFGLEGIKHVGIAALEEVLKQRAEKPFQNMFDFCERVDLRTINKRVIESFIFAGAFDSFASTGTTGTGADGTSTGGTSANGTSSHGTGARAQQQAAITLAIDQATERKHELSTGQMSLFSMEQPAEKSATSAARALPAAEAWSVTTTLEREKEVLGMFLSGHPLDAYRPYITALSATTGGQTVLSGMVTARKTIITKKGDPMAFVTLEASEKNFEIIVFPKLLKTVAPWLEQHTIFTIKGTFDENNVTKLKAQELIPIDLIREQGYGITDMIISMPAISDTIIQSLKQLLQPGKTKLIIKFNSATGPVQLTAHTKITVTQELMAFTHGQKLGVNLLW